jgi:hypothetical protein
MMEKIAGLCRQHLQSEAAAGYPLVRRLPSSRATAFLDYVEGISELERESLIDARARAAALGFVPSPAARQELLELIQSDRSLVQYNEAMLSGPIAMGLRYQSIRMAKAILNDAQSVEMMGRTRASLDYAPRDDAPVPLVNDPDVTKLHPAKAASLKKLVRPLLQNLLDASEEKSPGGTTTYSGSCAGTCIKVRIDYAARDVQMIYAVSIPDPQRKVVVVGFSYEALFGMTSRWDYITDENAEASIGLLPELIHRIVTLRNGVADIL